MFMLSRDLRSPERDRKRFVSSVNKTLLRRCYTRRRQLEMHSAVWLSCLCLSFSPPRICSSGLAINSWYVRFKTALTILQAREVARRNGFVCEGTILLQSDEYHFTHKGVPKISTQRSAGHVRLLKRDSLIDTAVQEIGYARDKRGYKPTVEEAFTGSVGQVASELSPSHIPNDPLYEKQWYLKNTGQAGGTPGLDLNVEAAWTKGITGKNVITAILDDGVDYMHTDLWDNFHAGASYDFSSNDPYPYPRYTDDGYNSHGTRCAGEVAAARDGRQTVGVAYNSRVAGLRMLDQPYMTDIIEAKAMGHKQTIIDIYSASWGPKDDGKTVDGPRKLATRAMVQGINEGRDGKGNIYVWASGDGGPLDNCNCDGYAGSMWTISINSVTNTGETAEYDESCSSTLASTFSNGEAGYEDAGVATTDLYGASTLIHSGTSAAAPQAAGVFALALEANPNITWRDLQHLVVLTSKRRLLHDASGTYVWRMNGIGFEFNHLFGFGILDAGDLVDLAMAWKTIPQRYHCNATATMVNRTFSSEHPLKLTVDTKGCEGESGEVNFLEHAQAIISIKAERRGNIVIYLTSPMNTRSVLLSKRPKDDDNIDGFNKWPFMTTQSWGENPRGRWLLEVMLDTDDTDQRGFLVDFTLVLHGTQESPYIGQPSNAKNTKLAFAKRQHSSGRFRKDSSRKRGSRRPLE